MFMDDLKLIMSSCQILLTQTDLEILNKWQNNWLVRLNLKDKKYKVLHIVPIPPPEYFLVDYILLYTESEQGLGVEMGEKCSWEQHIHMVIDMARKTTGWIGRNLTSREARYMVTVYRTLVHLSLEYTTQVWSLPSRRGSYGFILEIEQSNKNPQC